jgi:hypothetical protein
MAALNIEGRTVQVDDSFLKLPPDQQNATVDEIARSLKATPAAQEQAKTEPPPQRGLMNAITDIPGEVNAAAGEAIDNIKGLANRGQQGPIEGLMTTGKAVMGVPQLALSPVTGAIRAVGGNLMTQAEHAIGGVINPSVAAKDDLDKMYATAKGDVDLAMMGARPAGVPLKGPLPAAGPSLPGTPPPLGPADWQWQAPDPRVAPAPALTPGQEAATAAARLSETGEPVQLPRAVTTDSMPVQRAASVARNVPFAGDPLVKSAERALTQLGSKTAEVASGYGEAATPAAAGDAARESIRDWIKGKSAETSKKFYDQVNAAIDPAVNTELSETRQAAQAILDRRKNAGILDQSGAVKRIEEAVTNPKGLNYEGIKDLRTYVREIMDNPSLLPSDISGNELKSIYGALTSDLRESALNAGGERAVTAFDRANRHYALLSARRESLAKIVGTNGDVPAERVFDRLVTMASSKAGGDISKLSQARKAMGPEGWNEFAGGIVNQLGRDVEGNFSPQRFVTSYGKLSPAGKTLLFRSGGKDDLAKHLDDIAKVSSRFKELQKFANPSGTGQQALGGSVFAGLWLEPISTISSVLGARVVSEALSRPASAASIAKYGQAQEALVRQPSPVRAASYAMAVRNMLNTIGAKGTSVTDFMRTLQGPVPAGAQGEQQQPPRVGQ